MRKILFLLCLSFSCFSQRYKPYPVIFVQGMGNDITELYYQAIRFKFEYGYNSDFDGNRYPYILGGSRIDFCLNPDEDQSKGILDRKAGADGIYGDFKALPGKLDGNNDAFFVNFGIIDCAYTTEAALVKQGFALGIAIKKVLEATHTSKVIVVGTGMGGLAIREYLTNREDWVNASGSHAVAHVVTMGTPHGGYDGGGVSWRNTSEAVRDARGAYATGRKGIYLFGGYENDPGIRPDSIHTFTNRDINCNGSVSDTIVGLNQKPFPSDVSITCIIGANPPPADTVNIPVYSQDIFNFQKLAPNKSKVLTINPKYYPSTFFSLLSETRDAFNLELLSAIQDAMEFEQVTIEIGQSASGFFVSTDENAKLGSHKYKFSATKAGKMVLKFSTLGNIYKIELRNNTTGETTVNNFPSSPWITSLSKGDYTLIFNGGAASRERVGYSFTTSFCPTDGVKLTANANLCEGKEIELTATPGFAAYIWYRGERDIIGNNNKLQTNLPGVYSVVALGCDQNGTKSNELKIEKIPLPPKPMINVMNAGLQSSSASGYQWYLNGELIQGATQQVLTNFGTGQYSVVITDAKGCVNESSPFMITGLEDEAILKEVALFPNPSDGEFYLKLPTGKATTHLTALDGKILTSKELISDGTPIPYQTLGISAGTYLLQIKMNGQTKTLKVIVR